MFTWIAENYATLIVCAVIAALVALAIVSMALRKKKRGSVLGCGGSCSNCPMSGKCKSQTERGK